MTPPPTTPAQSPLHDPQLLVSTVQMASRVVKGLISEQLRREGISGPMFWTLHQIVLDGPIQVGHLAEVCSVTPAHVSMVVEDLVRDGLVARTRSASDRRVVTVAATSKGKTLHKGVWSRFSRRFGELLSGISPSDVAATARVMAHIVRATSGDLPRPEVLA